MERGYHATSIDDVAQRLGSTKGRVYHYHGSKTDPFFGVHRVGMQCLFDALAPALSTPGNEAAVLRAMLLAHATAMLDHHTYEPVVAQGLHVLRFNATTPDQRRTMQDLIDSRDRFKDRFQRQILAGMDDGSLRPTHVSVTAKVLLAGLQWAIFWYRPRASDTAETRRWLARKMVAPPVQGVQATP